MYQLLYSIYLQGSKGFSLSRINITEVTENFQHNLQVYITVHRCVKCTIHNTSKHYILLFYQFMKSSVRSGKRFTMVKLNESFFLRAINHTEQGIHYILYLRKVETTAANHSYIATLCVQQNVQQYNTYLHACTTVHKVNLYFIGSQLWIMSAITIFMHYKQEYIIIIRRESVQLVQAH